MDLSPTGSSGGIPGGEDGGTPHAEHGGYPEPPRHVKPDTLGTVLSWAILVVVVSLMVMYFAMLPGPATPSEPCSSVDPEYCAAKIIPGEIDEQFP